MDTRKTSPRSFGSGVFQDLYDSYRSLRVRFGDLAGLQIGRATSGCLRKRVFFKALAPNPWYDACGARPVRSRGADRGCTLRPFSESCQGAFEDLPGLQIELATSRCVGTIVVCKVVVADLVCDRYGGPPTHVIASLSFSCRGSLPARSASSNPSLPDGTQGSTWSWGYCGSLSSSVSSCAFLFGAKSLRSWARLPLATCF
jgi:hypothetical protein